jgi:hypothetical protein
MESGGYNMRFALKHQIGLLAFVVSLALLSVGPELGAQETRTLTISATALGTSTQTGRVNSVNIYIYEASTPDDQKALVEAFGENGSEGIVNALEKMSSKGRIAITGTLGFDLKYVRIFRMGDGTLNVRFVTDRVIRFAERWASSRTQDYALAMGEIFIKKENGKSSGTLMPAARFNLNKNGELEIEALQSPWNLTNVRTGTK